MGLLMRHLFHFISIYTKNYCIQSAYRTTRIVNLLATRPVGAPTCVKGWVITVRKMKENLFIDVNDGSCASKLQVVLLKSLKPDNLSFGASIEVVGKTLENANGQLELKADKVVVTGPCLIADGYPFAGKVAHPPEYIRKFLHLRSRTSSFTSVLRVRDAATRAIHNYFASEGYLNIHTPLLTSNDCEGAGEVFVVKPDNESLLKDMRKHGVSLDEAYFDAKVFLTVSGQLHLEALARGLGNVYTFGPTFRAENSRTRLHLSEFYMVEAEAAFMNNLNELLKIIEKFIKSITLNVIEVCNSDLKALQDDESQMIMNNLINKPFETLTFTEACNLLQEHFDGSKNVEKDGLNKEQELFLVNYLGKVPVFIVEWPETLKPFYMKQISESHKVAAVDLLAPKVGELCGGSVRENDRSVLERKLSELGQLDILSWYLDLRKFGNVPTAGFGMGFERFLQMLLGVDNIKDTIPFPRWPHNCNL